MCLASHLEGLALCLCQSFLFVSAHSVWFNVFFPEGLVTDFKPLYVHLREAAAEESFSQPSLSCLPFLPWLSSFLITGFMGDGVFSPQLFHQEFIPGLFNNIFFNEVPRSDHFVWIQPISKTLFTLIQKCHQRVCEMFVTSIDMNIRRARICCSDLG